MALRTNKILIFILKSSISAISLYIIFSKTDIRHTFYILRNTNIFYFLAAISLYILSQLASSFRWKMLLPERFRVRRLFSLYMIGAFFSTFLPGLIGGDVVKAYYLNKDAKKLSLTLASIFMDRYMGYLSLMIIGISALPFVSDYFGGSPYKWVMPLIFIAFVTGSFLFFGLKIGKRLSVISEFYDYFSLLWTRKEIIIKTLLTSLVIQFLNFSKVIILAAGVGADIPLLLFFVFLPIIITITTLPISISGLGLREGSFVLLLGLIGIEPELATSISIAWFLSIFVGSLPGLIVYILHKNKQE
ncbi:MAG: lysylphosphatidylglycerol synthase transmembrane domain-containing protein [Nitrospirota bacterium]